MSKDLEFRKDWEFKDDTGSEVCIGPVDGIGSDDGMRV